MDKNIQILKKSPLFHFSLHSKELFHSNFLEWLAKDSELQPIFKAVMKALGVADIGNDFEVLREKSNLDLIVKAPDQKKVSPKWYAVIENKVKSVPSKSQLDDYTDKIKENCGNDSESVAKILLTLADYKFDLAEGWRHVTYSTVVSVLEDAVHQVQNPYKKAIISDYIAMIKALVEIVNDIDISDDSEYLFVPCKEIEELRISDMIGKYRASRIANEITSKQNIPCSFNYTNKQALIESSVENEKINNYISMGIQIQGSQYRRYIVYQSELENTKKEKLKAEIVEKSNGFLCATREEFRKRMLQKFPDVFRPNKVRGEQNKPFCSYAGNDGRTFWYQYVTIKPEATIAQVVECMKEDFSMLKKLQEQ